MKEEAVYKIRFRLSAGPWQDRQLTEGEYIIGRDADCDLPFPAPSLSRRHAQLLLSESSLSITDLGSANGTQIEGQALAPGKAYPFAPGTSVKMGSLILSVTRSPSPPDQVGTDGTWDDISAKATAPSGPHAVHETPAEEGASRPTVAEAPDPLTLIVRSRYEQEDWAERVFHQMKIAIGRSTQSDFSIQHSKVSRLHALVEIADGELWITDQGSSNGTFLDGSRLESGKRNPLAAGQEVRIGPCRLKFYLPIQEDVRGIVISPRTSLASPGPESAVATRLHSSEELIRGDTLERRLDLAARERTTVGRSGDNDLVLDHPVVSRYHALIERSGARYRVVDLRSANGIFVNEERVPRDAWLREQDRLRIGPYVFLLSGSRLLARPDAGLLLEARGLQKWVRPGLNLLQNISVTIRPQEFVAFVGMSGAGKTTLLNALSGYQPANRGTVLVNGLDLYRHFDMFRSEIGYVPQRDIVHTELTPRLALDYAAQLRMPPDTSAAERSAAVEEVLATLGLAGKEQIQIARLSGGQIKRVSIGVELLTQPRLFFLDEPTSGLDPGTEYDMMRLLRNLADQGRTVMLVTHATKNVMLCDKVLFMARGGYLAYFGAPEQALAFFDRHRTGRERREKEMEFDDIYRILNDDSRGTPSEWAERSRKEREEETGEEISPELAAAREGPRYGNALPRRSSVTSWRQFTILSARNLRLLAQDRISLALMLLLAPGLGLLNFVWGPNTFDPVQGDAVRMMSIWFMMTIVCLLVGSLSSVREIVKEADVYRRERVVGVRIPPYVLSKVWVGVVLSAYQGGTLLLFCLLLVQPFRSPLVSPHSVTALFFTAFLGTLCGYLLGLAISALSPNQNFSMLLLIAVIVPQFLFAGVLLPLHAIPGGDEISRVIPARWTFEAFVNASGIGQSLADDPCWSKPRAVRLEMTDADKNSQCTCLGGKIFRQPCDGFPGIQSADYYDAQAKAALGLANPTNPTDLAIRQKAIGGAESVLNRIYDDYGQAYSGTVWNRWLPLGGILLSLFLLTLLFQKRKDSV